jgi:hypothetical protein
MTPEKVIARVARVRSNEVKPLELNFMSGDPVVVCQEVRRQEVAPAESVVR